MALLVTLGENTTFLVVDGYWYNVESIDFIDLTQEKIGITMLEKKHILSKEASDDLRDFLREREQSEGW